MGSKFLWSSLQKLVDIDYQISELKKKKERDLKNLSEAEKQILASEKQILSQAMALKEHQKKIDNLELSLRDLSSLLPKKRESLLTIHHQKECIALEKEIETLQQKADAIETEVISLLEELEMLQNNLSTHKAQHAELVTITAQAKADCAQRVASYEATITTLSSEWDASFTLVPQELGRRYAQMRARVPNPAVPVVSSSCSACFFTLLIADQQELNSNTVIECKGCHRYLFLPPHSVTTQTT